MKNLYFKLTLFLFFCLTNEAVFGNTVKMKRWGGEVVRQGQTIGLTWLTAAIVICGFLSILGMQFAQGMLAKILMGSSLVFGASAISGVLKAVFN